MPLPTLGKSWTIRSNIAIAVAAAVAECNKRWYLAWKDNLKALGVTVSGSSDSVTSGMDGSDRIAAWNNWVQAASGSAHSWIVLRFGSIGSTFCEVCIDLNNASVQAYLLTVVISFVGFGTTYGGTNGSTTARPTATDEAVYASASGCLSGGNTTVLDAHRGHFWGSSDGKAFYWIRAMQSNMYCFGFIAVPRNIPSDWTGNTVVFGCGDGTTTSANRAKWHNAAVAWAKLNSTAGNAYMTGEAYNGALISTSQNYSAEINAGYPMCPIGLFSTVTGARGRIADMWDLWWGAESNIVSGDTYPADGSRQFAQFGHFILPWDGSLPLIAN